MHWFRFILNGIQPFELVNLVQSALWFLGGLLLFLGSVILRVEYFSFRRLPLCQKNGKSSPIDQQGEDNISERSRDGDC